MSSQLSPGESAQQSALDVGKDGKTVTITFPISAEAVNTFAPKNVSDRAFQSNELLVLACGLHTAFRAEFDKSAGDDKRLWATAITRLQEAMYWAADGAKRG